MFCNASATLYHLDKDSGDWTTTYYPDVYWYDACSAVSEDTGLILTPNIKVFIPYSDAEAPSINIGHDFLLKGQGAAIDNTSEKTQSESLKTIGKVTTIKSYAPCLYGSKEMHHLEFVLY